MYLRELELIGFKSFLHKVRLEFTPGLTAIVGPNGSGKSNLVDAVRWVLGEQNSRLLRAEKMEEVIFNGTKRLKPLGRAEVSLTIDNRDGSLPLAYDEVRFTRRLFRSGESEYFINQAPCRLKDIQQLLMDTGLGKYGFAIIGQGEIEEFLWASPEERRLLIEEVAGIVRYRQRRREAEQKLAETQGHLLRLQDMMGELGRQAASLEQEAEVAKRYVALEEEIKSLERELGIIQWVSLKNRSLELVGRLAEVEGRLREIEEKSQRLEEELEKQRVLVAALREEAETARRAYQEAVMAKREAELDLEAASRERKSLIEERDRVIRAGEELRTNLDRLRKEIGAAEEELAQVLQEIAVLKIREQGILQELGSVEERTKAAAQQREQYRVEWDNLWYQILENQNELKKIEAEHQTAKVKVERLSLEERELREERTRAEERLLSVEKGVEELHSRIRGLERTLSQTSEEASEQRKKWEALREDLEKARHRWERCRSRLAVLREWQQGYDGFSQAVKAVMSAREKLWPDGKGIIGVVAELVKVPQELELAVEAALGGSLQHIVVRCENDAQKAIAFLKATSAGRATFLPLDAIRPRRLTVDRSVLNWAGVVGVAAELVEVPRECVTVVLHLLGDVLVVSHLDVALTLARRLGYRVRVVTLEGDLVNPGGSLTGGSHRVRTGGLLSRMREIGELASQAQTLAHTVSALQEEDRRLREKLEFLQNQEHRLKEELWAARAELSSMEKERQELLRRRLELDERLATVGWELSQFRQELEESSRRRRELEEKIAVYQERQAALGRELEDRGGGLEEEKAKLTGRLEEVRRALTGLREKEKQLEGNLSGWRELVARYGREEARHRDRLMELEEKICSTEQRLAELEKRANQTKEREEEWRKRCAETTDRYRAEDAAQEEKQQRLSRLVNQKRALEKHYRQLYQESAEVEANLRVLSERLAQEYGWHEGQGVPPLGRGEAELRATIVEKRREKEALGTVDTSVLPEYARLKERYEYFLREAQDLERAKSSLAKAMAEVEKLMEERLQQALKEVNRQLEEVFPALFGGGKAWLAPTGEGGLLESGLEVCVQLPGKRVPSLALLSGGERALAAIAVLFALLRTKPSPFCLLDEIDASLDEANVELFARFLRELSRERQFIVVSHRAATIEQAERVYGVTMEQEGVSTLVSLKLPHPEADERGMEVDLLGTS